jgi:hypothetical protein
MTILSEEQEEEVDGLIKEIQPETTVFVAVMKPSNVKRYSSLVSCALLFCQFFLKRINSAFKKATYGTILGLPV